MQSPLVLVAMVLVCTWAQATTEPPTAPPTEANTTTTEAPTEPPTAPPTEANTTTTEAPTEPPTAPPTEANTTTTEAPTTPPTEPANTTTTTEAHATTTTTGAPGTTPPVLPRRPDLTFCVGGAGAHTTCVFGVCRGSCSQPTQPAPQFLGVYDGECIAQVGYYGLNDVPFASIGVRLRPGPGNQALEYFSRTDCKGFIATNACDLFHSCSIFGGLRLGTKTAEETFAFGFDLGTQYCEDGTTKCLGGPATTAPAGPNVGAIVGGVFGGLVAVALIAGLAYWYVRRSRRIRYQAL